MKIFYVNSFLLLAGFAFTCPPHYAGFGFAFIKSQPHHKGHVQSDVGSTQRVLLRKERDLIKGRGVGNICKR